MKNNIFGIFVFLFAWCVFAVSSVCGQAQTVNLANGVSLEIENLIVPKVSENAEKKISKINILTLKGNVSLIHRILTDNENKIHFGYDIEIEKNEKNKRFTIKFKALSVALFAIGSESKSLMKYPEPLEIGEGDSVSIDLLENPKTKMKITDIFKLAATAPNALPDDALRLPIGDTSTTQIVTKFKIPDNAPPADFGLDKIQMQALVTNLSVNGSKIFEKKSAIGANIYFYLKGKGRFVLSPVPRANSNFQKVGIINENKISFSLNGDKYELISLMPILCAGGKWNLWVLYEPGYRPNSPEVNEEFGADTIEKLMKQ